MTDVPIDLTIQGGVARLELRRPDAANALTNAMIGALADAVGEAGKAGANFLLITGAGADFTIGRDRGEGLGGLTPYEAYRRIHAFNVALLGFPGVAIAAVQGRAHGFGVGAVMRCDIALAADDARFALDEVKVGLPPLFILSEMMEHLPPKAAADILLTSREFGAAEALGFGLVSRVVPAASLAAETEDLLAVLKARDGDALRATKRAIRQVREIPAAARPAFALVEQAAFSEARR